MALVPMSQLLDKAKREGYAVAAFNVENMEMLQAVLETAESLKAPVILQTTPSTVRYADLDMYRAMAETEAQHLTIPVAMHLDHGNSVELCRQAVDSKYTSVMFDGSKLPFDENIALTKEVVEFSHKNGVSVEAEIGIVGGKEDDLVSDHPVYTEVSEAKEFSDSTGVDALAVAVGTAHGFYHGEPKIGFERLADIISVVHTPIVLHGASGVPDDAIRKCVSIGICKVNFATELRDAFTKGAREVLKDSAVYDPKKYLGEGRSRVREIVEKKINLCGCAGKA